MELDDDVEISHIDLASGAIVYNYESSVNTSIELTIEIPSLKDRLKWVFLRPLK